MPPVLKVQITRIDTVIVGIRYYDGKDYLPGPLQFDRNPRNEFDGNAIEVSTIYDGVIHMVGHIRKELAAVLADFMDMEEIDIHGLISASEIRQFQYAIPIYLDIWTSSGNSNLKRMLIKTLHDHQHYTLDYHATPFMPVVFVNSTECLEAFKLFNVDCKEIKKGRKKKSEVTEKQLVAVSGCIGKQYQLLGINLGLTSVEIEHVQMNTHKYSSVQCTIFNMLVRWKKKIGQKATLSKFIKACKETGDVDIQEVKKMFPKKVNGCDMTLINVDVGNAFREWGVA
ncbi:uncharacterized protein LOC125654284 [Ostrea edulis]|uniref:uncharacterized protein LOC125654284 n=1 Tax=Ostrea edulis TaxID=37623 RepID=UPI0024AF2BE4|nr:uncharacterized protein LOC125654284 [Ostrea edulis]XP_055999917.1 uncharacterized protein LOC125654284 [Ostrea edulis]